MKWKKLCFVLLIVLASVFSIAYAEQDFGKVTPGSIIEITFMVSENPNLVANATVSFVFDSSAFEILPSEIVRDSKAIVMDIGSIQLGYTVPVSFQVSPNAKEGKYEFRCVPEQNTMIDPLGRYRDGLQFETVYVTVSKEVEYGDYNFSYKNGVPTFDVTETSHTGPVYSAMEYGYNSYVRVDFGLKKDGRIDWIDIGNAGFEEKRADVVLKRSFRDQFIGLKLPVSIGEIDGYTGATITTKAIIRAINKANDNILVSKGGNRIYPVFDQKRGHIYQVKIPIGKEYAVLTTGEKTLKDGPFISSKTIATLSANTILAVIGEAIDSKGVKWLQVMDELGNIGYIQYSDVRIYDYWCGTPMIEFLEEVREKRAYPTYSGLDPATTPKPSPKSTDPDSVTTVEFHYGDTLTIPPKPPTTPKPQNPKPRIPIPIG